MINRIRVDDDRVLVRAALTRALRDSFPALEVITTQRGERCVELGDPRSVAPRTYRTDAFDSIEHLVRELGRVADARGPSAYLAVTAGSPRLTARQRAVQRLVEQGLTAEAIGARLGISHRTVEGHKQAARVRTAVHGANGVV